MSNRRIFSNIQKIVPISLSRSFCSYIVIIFHNVSRTESQDINSHFNL